METDSYHEPVLVREVIEGLHFDSQARIIDATVGTGGHSLEIIKTGAFVLGIDNDQEMLKVAEKRLEKACPTPELKARRCFKLVRGNFKDIDMIAAANDLKGVDGALFDLGVSNLQLTSVTRGFSFGNPEADLDMRIDTASQGLTGADLLNALRPDQLSWLFAKVLSRFEAKKIAKTIARTREIQKFHTIGDFLEVCRVLRGKPGLHPATLAFLALRMVVNSELENLEEALPKAYSLLNKGSRLLVITFHSGEEKIVVGFFRKLDRENLARFLTKDPIIAKDDEVARNPRSRSAKLYILEKMI